MVSRVAEDGDIRAAWKEYLYQRVPAALESQVRNFMKASYAEGRNEDDEDAGSRACKLPAVTCRLSAEGVANMLQQSASRLSGRSDVDRSNADPGGTLKKLHEATSAAVR